MPPSTGRDRGEMILYQRPDGGVELDVRLEHESIWLSLNQMVELFERDKSVVSRHLRAVFRSGELEREAVVAKNATTAADGKTYQVEYYNLDAIISVGYRVNSKRGTQFRIWATRVLRDHTLQGYTINAKRLQDLNQAVRLISDVVERKSLSGDEATALLRVVGEYSRALELLDDYDHQRVRVPGASRKSTHMMSCEEARRIVGHLKLRFGESTVFGVEKDNSLESALGAVMQTAATPVRSRPRVKSSAN